MNNEMKISGIILGAIAFGLLVIPIFASQDIYFLNSGTGSGSNVTLAFDDLTDVVIFNAISGQIVVYNGTYWNNVNATTFSDTTTCNNLGSGTFICAGDNVNLKSLKASLGLSISNDSTSITYRTNFANGTGVSITGSGLQTFTNTGVISLAGSDGIVTTNLGFGGQWAIGNTLPEDTNAINLGSVSTLSEGIFASESSNDLSVKRLLEGSNIALSCNVT